MLSSFLRSRPSGAFRAFTEGWDPMKTRSARATGDLLNGLVIACHDDIRAQSATARLVAGERKDRLDDSVRQRAGFVAELGGFIRELGATPRAGGSVSELLRQTLQGARSLLVGDHSGDRYAICARVEGLTEALYGRALQGDLPDSVRLVVERQHAAIAADREELRRRSIL